MHLNESFCVDRVWVASQLIDLGVYLFSNVAEEVLLGCWLCREFFSNVEILGTSPTLELAEDNHLVRLGDEQGLIFTSLLDCGQFWVALEELSEDLFALVDEHALHWW